jgi:co-chaperonin GroES (HSP10)
MIKAAFSAHKIRKEQLKPLNDVVIISEMNFDERLSNGGIVLVKDNGKSLGIRPRWGKVYAVGPDQHSVKVGTWICVEHGRWGRTIELDVGDDEPLELRVVDPNAVMLISDKLPDDITLIKKG